LEAFFGWVSLYH